jgi:hypothetical protein
MAGGDCGGTAGAGVGEGVAGAAAGAVWLSSAKALPTVAVNNNAARSATTAAPQMLLGFANLVMASWRLQTQQST